MPRRSKGRHRSKTTKLRRKSRQRSKPKRRFSAKKSKKTRRRSKSKSRRKSKTKRSRKLSYGAWFNRRSRSDSLKEKYDDVTGKMRDENKLESFKKREEGLQDELDQLKCYIKVIRDKGKTVPRHVTQTYNKKDEEHIDVVNDIKNLYRKRSLFNVVREQTPFKIKKSKYKPLKYETEESDESSVSSYSSSPRYSGPRYSGLSF